MDIPELIEAHLAGQPEPKQTDLRALHAHLRADFPEARLWFTDGTAEAGNAETLHAAIRHGKTVDQTP